MLKRILRKVIPSKTQRLMEAHNEWAILEERVQEKYEQELGRHPVITVMGPTGVGKSLTINRLFGTDLEVGHSSATTRHPTPIIIDDIRPSKESGTNGKIILYDMPGIGEDLQIDELNKKKYVEIISESDVALWILSAPDWQIAYDQMWIRDIVRYANPEIINRIVIGINKVDILHPNNWDEAINLPSREQEKYMRERLQDAFSKLAKYCPGLTLDNIVPYSAEKKFQLPHLFRAMLRATPKQRAWVVESRKSIADFRDMVNPELLQQIEMRGR